MCSYIDILQWKNHSDDFWHRNFISPAWKLDNLYYHDVNYRLVVRYSKKSPNQESGLWNRWCLKVLNDTKLILYDLGVTQAHLGPIWYHTEPLNIPYTPTPVSYNKTSLAVKIQGPFGNLNNHQASPYPCRQFSLVNYKALQLWSLMKLCSTLI